MISKYILNGYCISMWILPNNLNFSVYISVYICILFYDYFRGLYTSYHKVSSRRPKGGRISETPTWCTRDSSLRSEWQFVSIGIYFPSLFFFRNIFFHHQVFDDKVLALHGVLAHVELQQVLHQVVLAEADFFEAHILANEVLELVGRDFT